MRRVPQVPQVAGQAPAEAMAALAAALQPADPLRRARSLAEAADRGLALTNDDMATLLEQGMTSWRDGHQAYGYSFTRYKQGAQVLWSVNRSIGAAGASPAPALPAGGTSPATSRQVGFGAVLDVEWGAIDTTGSRLFAQNAIAGR